MEKNRTAAVTLWANRAILVLLGVLVFAMPGMLSWYQGFRPLGLHGAAAVFFGFYLCVIPVGMALWRIEKLLRNILADRVFVADNVILIRRIRGCCLAVMAVCGIAGYFYQPLLFLAIIMGFLSLMVSVMGHVMAAAVDIREENDLTV